VFSNKGYFELESPHVNSILKWGNNKKCDQERVNGCSINVSPWGSFILGVLTRRCSFTYFKCWYSNKINIYEMTRYSSCRKLTDFAVLEWQFMETIESVGKNHSVEELLKVRICEEHNCLKCCFLYLSSTFFILICLVIR